MKIKLLSKGFCQKYNKKEIPIKDIKLPRDIDWGIGDLAKAVTVVKKIKKGGNIWVTDDGYVTFKVPDGSGNWIDIEQHITNLVSESEASEDYRYLKTLKDWLPKSGPPPVKLKKKKKLKTKKKTK